MYGDHIDQTLQNVKKAERELKTIQSILKERGLSSTVTPGDQLVDPSLQINPRGPHVQGCADGGFLLTEADNDAYMYETPKEVIGHIDEMIESLI